MSRAENIVSRYVSDCAHCNDPEQLRKKAAVLRAYAAWEEADNAERKAQQLERQQADGLNA
jgi:hypothetical protein